MNPPMRLSHHYRRARLLLTAVASCFPVAPRVVHGCDACQSRLVDESLDPPVAFSPDWAESVPAGSSPPLRRPKAPLVPAARQPQGVLSGRIVFLNGGHGWTWDPNYWRLQRGISNEMNEDMGNLDQMNLFAAWCFHAGAVVVPMRPLGQQPHEVVMDNDDPGVTWTGTWANSTSPIFYGSAGDLPYRYATLAAAESATATYTPDLPAAGCYPVYTWVRHGSDRTLQLYRIRHTGGETEVRIPHHMVGNGWVYLGEYHFRAGSDPARGSVVVSNQRSIAAGSYTFADAIRFGNGMGSVNRGTGPSSYPREEESCRYWMQAHLGQGQSTTLYDGSGNDESDSWSAPPKWSAEMNREAAGSQADRIHISFHSNAGGGRGTIALITSDPTPNQTRLAQICGQEVNADLVALGSPPLELRWNNRSSVTYSGGYSEIDGSLFNYEMDATIIEVAFHDSADDARLMRDPKARSAVGKAAMHAVVRYMNEFGGGALAFPPEAPTGLRARTVTDGSVVLEWKAPVASGGSGPPTGYVIYRSANGHGFGSPLVIGNVLSHTVSGLQPGETQFFRVAAVNAAGESFPTETAGVRTPSSASGRRVLFVNAFDRFERTLNLRQNLTRQQYAPPGATGSIERVLPRRSNSSDYVVPHGLALAAAGYAFDSCQNEDVAGGAINLSGYRTVIWASGQESIADETFSASEQDKLAAFRLAGGSLLVSGSEIARDLAGSAGPTAADRTFFAQHLRATFSSDAADHSGSHALAATGDGIFRGMAPLTIDNGSRGIYPVQSPDVIGQAGSGCLAALNYSGGSGGAGAIQYDGSAGGGRVVYFGFPFECMVPAEAGQEVLRRALEFLDGPEPLAAAGGVWRYLDNGTVPSAAWTGTAYDDSAWPAGAAQLGFGDGDEVTLLNADPARTVTWFRRSFAVTDADAVSQLQVSLLRDDGAVVYLNGHEIVRSNLPPGLLTPSTQASTAIGGADESAFLPFAADARLLRRGDNLLAVQVHQSGTSSSDLSFDLALAGSTASPRTLMAAGSVWRFRDTGVPPPANWKLSSYSDADWSTGAGRLGYGGDGERTTLSFGGNPDAVHPVTWLRHTLTVPDAASFDALRFRVQRDDGFVLHLNGREILRDNLRSGPLASDALATVAITGSAETEWLTFTLPSTGLVAGSNVLAVQLHQSALSSSDLGFDLALEGIVRASLSFSAWQAAAFASDRFAADLAGELADPDRDGVANLLEYATGSLPWRADFASLPAVSFRGGRMVLAFPRSPLATDATLRIESADSPAGPWTVLAVGAAGNPLTTATDGVSVVEDPGGPVRSVEVSVAVPGPARRFFRLAANR
jgi:hypothetical protein